MTRIVRRRFAADERSVPAARRFALGALENVGDDVRDVVALMVSELATNALLHAQTAFVVDVTLVADADEIVVAVHDGAGGRPVIKDPGPTDAHGRGLRIVAALADRWGTGRSDQEPGTVVWFAVRRSGRSAATRRAAGGWADQQPAHSTGRCVRPMLATGRRGASARRADAGASTRRAASVPEGVAAGTGNLAP